MTRFSMSPTDQNGQEIQVGDWVCRRSSPVPWVVDSINVTPEVGRWISTADGPEQLIHSRILISDLAGVYMQSNVLAQTVRVIRKAVRG